MRKVWLLLLALGVGLVFSFTATAAKEPTVPLKQVKASESCYSKVDLTKSEFQFSKLGKECVTEKWLRNNQIPKEEKSDKSVKEKEEQSGSSPNSLSVPPGAVRPRIRVNLSQEQKDKKELKAPISWVKNSWLEDNKPKLARNKAISLLGTEPTIKEVVQEINTPRQLAVFMNNYFVTKSFSNRKGVIAFSPSKMLETQAGDCKDWATFSSYVLKKNGYDAQKLSIPKNPIDDGHILTIWKNSKGEYQIMEFTRFYWNAGKTVEEVIETIKQEYDEVEKIYTYKVTDPMTLELRKKVGPKIAKVSLEQIPHSKNLTEDQLKLGQREGEGNSFQGRIVKVENLDHNKYLITFVVDLHKIYKEASKRFVLIDVIANSNTVYMSYNWSNGEMEYKNFDEVVWVGEKGGFTPKETSPVNQIEQYNAEELWSH